MNGHTNPQIIESNGKKNTLPHEVVKMNLKQGYSLLKSWRVYFGISQAELANQVKATQSQIANYENEKSIPRTDTLLKISNTLGVSADLLMDFD